ncbi:unnamed protein product [Scytosiphon promiscuus]
MIWLWEVLVVFLQGLLLGCADVVGASDEGQSPQTCWVFSHMNKSGGQTVKLMLRHTWIRKTFQAIEGIYDSSQWIKSGAYAERFLRHNYTLTTGGYTEGLRPRGEQPCTWFTVFRHPVSRVVSAYFYCKHSARDQLCASHIVDAREVDLLTFAEHWGNYGARQFLLAFVLPEEVLASNVGSDISACGDQREALGRRATCPGWYRLKLYVERQSTCSGLGLQYEKEESACEPGQESLTESWLLKFLQPIEDILATKYAAVGVLEEWETTLLLFNATLGIPGVDWPKMLAGGTQKNAYHAQKLSDGTFYEDPKVEMLRQAWIDPELKKLLWFDLLLYDHAVQIFHRQVEARGLS